MTDKAFSFRYIYSIKLIITEDLIMDTKEVEDKLQRGYHTMINSIEASFKKDKVSLEQALETAEAKLDDWEDLTNEQYKHIKKEVRHDLHALGRQLEDAKTSFRDRLEMDTHFMKKSVANKFASLADKTTHEFMEIKESLFEKDDTQSTDEKIQAEHHDHSKWHDDHSFWMTEIAMWRKEIHDAEAKVLAIHAAINKHEISLQKHVKDIKTHEELEHEHEIKLAELEKSHKNDNEENSKDQLTHEKMSSTHNSHALLHQQFKNKHRAIMILVEQLNDLTKG
jgi:hypothetical protein